MLSSSFDFLTSLPFPAEMVALSGLGLGVLVFIFGLVASVDGPSASLRRMHAGGGRRSASDDFDLILGEDNNPNSLLRAFVPTSKSERTQIQKKLRQAGIHRRNAVRIYYGIRTLLGLVLPTVFLAWIFLPSDVKTSLPLPDRLTGLSWMTSFQIVTGLVLLGFYGPAAWLQGRIRARRQAISDSLPNALDLLQVAIEAGLGFDAAILRISHELASVAPDISKEFMMLELEIQAGKDRQTAFLDMADRTGVAEVMAFANVILQAGHFGTSVSTALHTFAVDMRMTRELRAQEKANRLPVQMSGVMALLMMPVLLMVCLTPMLIRWLTMFN